MSEFEGWAERVKNPSSAHPWRWAQLNKFSLKSLGGSQGHRGKAHNRSVIDDEQGITGTIYVPKDKKIPDSVTISLKTKQEREK